MADYLFMKRMVQGVKIAYDEIAGVFFQRVKLVIGANGVNDGDVSAENPFPVILVGAQQPNGDITVYPTETSDLLDLTLSLNTAQYASGNVLADTQELTGVMRANGKTARLESLKITDKDDQGQALDVVFFKTNVSLGTENAAVSISDADAVEILGIVQVSAADFIDLGGVRVATVPISPFLLKAAANSTSIYVGAISRGTGTYTASGLSMKIGIVRL